MQFTVEAESELISFPRCPMPKRLPPPPRTDLNASLNRRHWLKGIALGLFSLPLFRKGNPLAQSRGSDGPPSLPIQPGNISPRGLMALAQKMRQDALSAGDQAYGAIVFRMGKVIGQSPSRVVQLRDPTAHAELEAIRDAVRNLGNPSLAGATLYSTSRPCPMCEAAAYWAGISSLVYTLALKGHHPPKLC